MKLRTLSTSCCLIFFCALAACILSCGGGGGGSSDPSVIEGNVLDTSGQARLPKKERSLLARLSLVSEAQAVLAGVQVSVRDSGIGTVTDDSGSFRLEGDFNGDVIVDFLAPEGAGSLSVNVPEGDRVVLQDVRLDVSQGAASPAQIVVIDDTPANENQNGNDNVNNNAGDDDNTNSNGNANTNGNGNNNGDDDDNSNANTNANTNVNSNTNANTNTNSNSNSNNNVDDDSDDDNVNSNGNVNSNENSNGNTNSDDD